MTKYRITLTRHGVKGFLSHNSIETDAINAMQSIPDVQNPEVIEEWEERVLLEYEWTGKRKFWDTHEYLAEHGLTIADDE